MYIADQRPQDTPIIQGISASGSKESSAKNENPFDSLIEKNFLAKWKKEGKDALMRH